MTAEQYREVREHFHVLCDLGVDERRRRLVAIRDEEVRAEVESLLSHTDAAFLESSPLIGSMEPRVVGSYSIEREIGRGGMGVVYLARRAGEEFDQKVALKLIKRGIDTDALVERFRRERRILATLEHPNIARLLDGGTTADGRPYFVMEHVEGERIDVWCRSHAPTVAATIRLFLDVCSAVQYAHQKLVIHRDLKPGNVIVPPGGVPKLLDFGIAKVLAEDGQSEVTALTSADMRPLTPDYASPEQLRGEAMSVASDVYSLAVMLYELLTGALPFEVSGRPAAERSELLETTEPRRPSVVARDRAAWSRALEGDLDTILLMALRRDPGRRYASVAAFASDLQRHLDGFPVAARADTLPYRLGKFAKRHSVSLAFAGAMTVAVIGGLWATTFEAQRARAARARAERVSLQARRMASTLIFDVHDAIAHLPGASAARETIVRNATRYFDALARESAGDPVVQRELALAYVRLASVYQAEGLSNYDKVSEFAAKALAIQKDLVRRSPGDLILQNELASTYDILTDLGGRQGLDMALRSIAIRERLVSRYPKDLRYRRGLEFSCQRASDLLGNPIWHNFHRPAEAVPYSQRSVQLGEEVLRADPGNVQSFLELADDEVELSAVLFESGRTDEALTHAIRTEQILDAAAHRFPTDTEVSRNAAGVRLRAAGYLEALRRYDDALASARASVERYERLAPVDPKNGLLQGERASALTTEARALRELGHVDESLAIDRKVLAIIDSAPIVHARENRRARAELEYAYGLNSSRQFDEAASHAAGAVKVMNAVGDTRASEATILLGDILKNRGDVRGATDAYREALASASAGSSDPILRATADEAKARLAELR